MACIVLRPPKLVSLIAVLLIDEKQIEVLRIIDKAVSFFIPILLVF